MPRSIWKGAVSFGLVHVPVALYPASREDGVDFDWLDKRTMDPVGYKRINKRTGKEITRENIVKGVKHESGDYVVLSDEEIRNAYPRATQTIEIEQFVAADRISFVYLEKPYYLEPLGKAGKPYTLLREAMAESGLIGIARLVIHNKEHLAALLPAGPALMLGTLRWTSEIRSPQELKLPPEGPGRLKDSELKMARQLIEEMAAEWDPEQFRDEFAQSIHALVARKASAGETHAVEPLEAAPAVGGDNVVDLTELLRSSLGRPMRKSDKEDAPKGGGRGGKSARGKRAA